ncbi:MAG: rRNA maturation RNase YbeY [Pirellulales bacterium]
MPPSNSYSIAINNAQTRWPVDRRRIRQAVRAILAGEGFAAGEVSIAVVDDPTIHRLNRQFLQHDYPTDVLSFLLGESDDQSAEGRSLEGEVIVSADTAAQSAERYGWRAEDELLLYVIHGTLHLTGYDDLEPELQIQMRERERHYLAQFGLTPRYAAADDEA